MYKHVPINLYMSIEHPTKIQLLSNRVCDMCSCVWIGIEICTVYKNVY